MSPKTEGTVPGISRFALFWGLVCGTCCLAAESSSPANVSLKPIAIAQLRRHVATLADDAMEGREAGTQGGRAAATYIRRELKEMGIQPAGVAGSYFQPFQAGYRNILAKIPGQHEKLKSEVIVLSAHFDHVGYGSKKTSKGQIGLIHNGADDNASGVAALLEIANSLKQAELHRTLLIIFWDAEEKGLWGSKYWLAQPTVPVDNIELMVNVDMIGRLSESLGLYGTRSMPGLRFAWSQANRSTELKLNFPWRVQNNSDHYPFFSRGVPITMVHTGLHDDYHKASDDEHRLNYDGLQRSAELVRQFVVGMANRESIADFRSANLKETDALQRQFEQPPAGRPMRLGVRLSTNDAPGVVVESVELGSKADATGIVPGDVMTIINQQEVNSIADVRRRIAEAHSGLEIVVMRQGDRRVLNVPPDLPPPRVGISWRTTDAEPNAVVVSNVVSGSPAADAGLQRLDRIHRVNGELVGDASEFRGQMTRADLLSLRVERDGRLFGVEVRLPPDEKVGPVETNEASDAASRNSDAKQALPAP